MSVRVPDRRLSSMEYVHNAQQLVSLVKDRISKYVNKIANEKRYKTFVKSAQYSVWNSPIYHAQMVYQYCQLANDKTRTSEERLASVEDACRNLRMLETALQTFYDSFRVVVKDKFIVLATEKIDKEKALLDGVKTYLRNAS